MTNDAASAAPAKEPRPTRSPAEIEADLERARLALADSIDEITDQTRPAALVERAQRSVSAKLQRPDGSWDPTKVAVVAGVTLVLVLFLVRRRHA